MTNSNSSTEGDTTDNDSTVNRAENANDDIALPERVGADYRPPAQFTEPVTATRPRMWLASAGTANNRFAIVGSDHVALWYGDFEPNDDDHPHGDPQRAELAAARRAIWLAGQARRSEIAAARAILHLTLARDLDSDALARGADRYGLDLEIVVDAENPALAWCGWRGRRRWRAVTIAALANGRTKPTPDEVITARESELRAATTHGQVYRIVAEHGLNTAQLFPLFKRALFDRLGIDYEDLRASTEAARHAAADEIAHAVEQAPAYITLSVAAHAGLHRYAVCGQAGQPLWYGPFHDDESTDDQRRADHVAARKAIWLAGRARLAADVPAAILRLTVSSPALLEDTWLDGAATAERLQLEMRVADIDNPARTWCDGTGWLNYRSSSTPLAALIARIPS